MHGHAHCVIIGGKRGFYWRKIVSPYQFIETREIWDKNISGKIVLNISDSAWVITVEHIVAAVLACSIQSGLFVNARLFRQLFALMIQRKQLVLLNYKMLARNVDEQLSNQSWTWTRSSVEPEAAEFHAELDQTVQCAVCHSGCSIRRAARSWT